MSSGKEHPRSGSRSDEPTFDRLLAEAQTGDREAVGKLIEDCRDYLLLIANRDMNRELRPKIGASDLVQETMLTAQASFAQFEGNSKDHLVAWIRRILINDIRENRRHFKDIRKREINRETRLDDSQNAGQEIIDGLLTPGTQAVRNEEAERLYEVMSGLPEEYQEVLQMRNWQQMSYNEIGKHLGRSPEAVRKLWSRAVLKLQAAMRDATGLPPSDSNPDSASDS